MKLLKLVLGLVLFWTGNIYALTLSEIRSQTRIAVRDNPADTARRTYADSVYNDLINEGQKEIVNLTWLADKTSSYILSAGVTYYSLPTDTLAVHQVYFTDVSNQLRELKEAGQRSLYDDNPSWETQPGTPMEYWVSGPTLPAANVSAPLRISYIPIPDRTSTGTVTIWFYTQIGDLSSDSDVPFENRRVLYTYHSALVYYAAMRIFILENSQEAATYKDLYGFSVTGMRENLGRMPNFNPSFSIPSIKR